MTLRMLGWEQELIAWAEQCPEPGDEVESEHLGSRALVPAYRECARVTSVHSRTFYMASALLPTPKRQAVRALYAFCRRTDDLVDREDRDAAPARLARWRAQTLSGRTRTDDPVAMAWADTRRRYRIPRCYVEQFLDGVSRDLTQTRYRTFGDLAQYAYGVASTVGLMVAHIIGFSGPQAIPYAVKLGVALQVTNILRDVGEDWRAGRLYLPQDELEAYRITAADIAAGRMTGQWRSFMSFQIERNRRLYAEAWPGIAALNPDGRFAIGAAAALYESILDDIAAHDGDVFTRRAHLGLAGKLRRLPRIWWRVQQVTTSAAQTVQSQPQI